MTCFGNSASSSYIFCALHSSPVLLQFSALREFYSSEARFLLMWLGAPHLPLPVRMVRRGRLPARKPGKEHCAEHYEKTERRPRIFSSENKLLYFIANDASSHMSLGKMTSVGEGSSTITHFSWLVTPEVHHRLSFSHNGALKSQTSFRFMLAI
jgi:hypothetical protein